MKFSVALVSFAITVVLAAPPLNPRQNDVPDCEDGGSAEHLEIYKNSAECLKACYLREQAENDNHLGVCKGQCKPYSHMSLEVVCHGRGPESSQEA